MHVHVADIQRGLRRWLRKLKADGETVHRASCNVGGGLS